MFSSSAELGVGVGAGHVRRFSVAVRVPFSWQTLGLIEHFRPMVDRRDIIHFPFSTHGSIRLEMLTERWAHHFRLSDLTLPLILPLRTPEEVGNCGCAAVRDDNMRLRLTIKACILSIRLSFLKSTIWRPISAPLRLVERELIVVRHVMLWYRPVTVV